MSYHVMEIIQLSASVQVIWIAAAAISALVKHK